MTTEEVKESFNQRGVTFADWAKEHNFSYRSVINVMNGANKGRRGEAHRIAVALGLKKGAA